MARSKGERATPNAREPCTHIESLEYKVQVGSITMLRVTPSFILPFPKLQQNEYRTGRCFIVPTNLDFDHHRARFSISLILGFSSYISYYVILLQIFVTHADI
jgi:hypothetical protein